MLSIHLLEGIAVKPKQGVDSSIFTTFDDMVLRDFTQLVENGGITLCHEVK